MIRNLWSIWIMLFYVLFCNIIKVNHFCIVALYCYAKSVLFHLLDLGSFHMRMFLLNQLIILLSFELKEILLIYSVKTLCLLRLNLCCVFNIVFYEFFMIFVNTIHVSLIFSQVILFYYFILFSSWVASKQFL